MKHVWLAAVCLCLIAWPTRAQETLSIKSFSPKSGDVGDTVEIQGSNFRGLAQVTFDGVPAEAHYTEDKITATVPPNAKTGPIGVSGLSGGASTSHDFIVVSNSAVPVITSDTIVVAKQDQPFSYQIEADRPVSGYAAGDLPPGLTLDPASGLISGTLMDLGTFRTQISATDAIGTGSAQLTIGVALTPYVVTLSPAPARILADEGQTGAFVINLSRPAPRPAYIYYQIKGSAVYGISYQRLPTHVQVQTGESSVNLPVVPILPSSPSNKNSGVRTVKLVLSDNAEDYSVGKPAAAKLKIVFP